LFLFQRLLLGLTLLGTLTNNPPLPPTTAPALWLPTPPGQTWRVIQGYGCGTHDDWDFYSLDLAAAQGESAGAPVYAAADGTILAWVEPSGTLILDHGSGLYTMYTHMASAFSTQTGQAAPRGTQVGVVGDRGAPGMPHLHFTAFTASGPWGHGLRQSVPLRFAEGYDLPDIGGCNQHVGVELVSGNRPSSVPGYRVYIPQAFNSLSTPQRAQAPDSAAAAPPTSRLAQRLALHESGCLCRRYSDLLECL
jgi:murein DD-endopeptidase MepM/ murein hydrolase activator NlpD